MTIVGYARVSTTDQDLSIQETALRAAGCDTIRAEKRSGTTTAGREELQTVLDFLRPGDVLMVIRIDRLARSIGDLQDIVRTVKARGASLKATEQPIDTGTAAGKCFLGGELPLIRGACCYVCPDRRSRRRLDRDDHLCGDVLGLQCHRGDSRNLDFSLTIRVRRSGVREIQARSPLAGYMGKWLPEEQIMPTRR
jgi:hypothetical protein